MSIGPGRIMRCIKTHLDTNPGRTFTVPDLCFVCYGKRRRRNAPYPRRQTVSVIRALKSVLKKDKAWSLRREKKPGGAYLLKPATPKVKRKRAVS